MYPRIVFFVLVILSFSVFIVHNNPSPAVTSVAEISVIQPSNYCNGTCWQYDEIAHTMTWTGVLNGREDIWQGDDLSLSRIRDGWVAIFGPLSVPGEIEACVLNVNNQEVINSCDGMKQPYPIKSNSIYRVTSTNSTVGGFRWKPMRGYGYRNPFDLAITPPTNAHFEIPFWVIPGGMRQLTISTSWTYKCYTDRNPLTETIQISPTQCTLATWEFIPREAIHGSNLAAQEWGRNWNGIFTQHQISVDGSERLIAFSSGENKNEYIGGNCGINSIPYQNTINANVLCSDCASEYCNNTYSDCWNAYNGFVNMSWQYYDAAHAWGLQSHIEEGPILWPSNGYTYNGQKSSIGVRHPHGFVDQDYIWVFYTDNGIKVARAPVNSGGLPGNWKSYCNNSWVDSLPTGFNVNNISNFYPQKGGCSSEIIPKGNSQEIQENFAVAKTEQGDYLGIEERHTNQQWELSLWRSSDLINWRYIQTLHSVNGDWSQGDLHYPVFLSSDAWNSSSINQNDFYIIGTKDGNVHALHIYNGMDNHPFATATPTTVSITTRTSTQTAVGTSIVPTITMPTLTSTIIVKYQLYLPISIK